MKRRTFIKTILASLAIPFVPGAEVVKPVTDNTIALWTGSSSECLGGRVATAEILQTYGSVTTKYMTVDVTSVCSAPPVEFSYVIS